jgi:hypothetical protein
MTWDFKRLLYCSAKRLRIESCADLNDPLLQARLQQHFDSVGGFPPLGSAEEYSAFFEAAYPSEADRRRYIAEAALRAKPSYGHIALAALMEIDKLRVAWTTNFDRLPEDAAALVLGSSARLTTATIESADIAREALNEGRWPFLGKLHGDFQSRQLRNTPDELRRQDERLRRALVETCRRFGLVVIGYSGRDDSVMDALEEGIDDGAGYPNGLFWLHHGSAAPLERVSRLIERATGAGIEADVLSIGTFDEFMADVLKMLPGLPTPIQAVINQRTQRITDVALPTKGGVWPVVRLNALRIDPAPASCRLVKCEIGGAREVRDVVQRAGAALVVARRQAGVLAFGSDSEVRRVFRDFGITALDVYALEARRFRYDSAELGLVYDALTQAITRELPLISHWRNGAHVAYVAPDRVGDSRLGPLRQVVPSLSGVMPGSNLRWAEAIRLRLEYRLEALWLLIEPTVWVESIQDRTLTERAGAFIRERVANRYNAPTNNIVAAWASVLTSGRAACELRAFGIGDGVDAAFTLHSATAFSRRIVSRRQPRIEE